MGCLQGFWMSKKIVNSAVIFSIRSAHWRRLAYARRPPRACFFGNAGYNLLLRLLLFLSSLFLLAFSCFWGCGLTDRTGGWGAGLRGRPLRSRSTDRRGSGDLRPCTLPFPKGISFGHLLKKAGQKLCAMIYRNFALCNFTFLLIYSFN